MGEEEAYTYSGIAAILTCLMILMLNNSFHFLSFHYRNITPILIIGLHKEGGYESASCCLCLLFTATSQAMSMVDELSEAEPFQTHCLTRGLWEKIVETTVWALRFRVLYLRQSRQQSRTRVLTPRPWHMTYSLQKARM